MTTHVPFRYWGFLLLLFVNVCAWAQPVSVPTTSPFSPPSISGGAVDFGASSGRGNISDSKKEMDALRRAGFTEEQIQRYLRAKSDPELSFSAPKMDSVKKRLDSTKILTVDEALEKIKVDSILYEQRIKDYTLQRQRRIDSLTAIRREMQEMVYGHHIFEFERPPLDVDSSTVASDDYVVQVGDIIYVEVWKSSELNDVLPVEMDGSVYREYMGKKFVAGMTYKETRDLLEKSYRSMVPDGAKVKVMLAPRYRTISVGIYGEVKKPGTYNVKASTTAFNALWIAGGINDIGSVRKIQIRRAGKLLKEFDLYEYLLEGKLTSIYLQDKDYIYIPVLGKTAKVEGEVKRPMRYELKEGENMNTLIQLAGGLTPTARSKGQLYRIENDELSVLDISLDKNNLGGFNVKDGDRLRVAYFSDLVRNLVSIRGAVPFPGEYEVKPGARVKDLIEKAGGVLDSAYLERAVLVRTLKNGQRSSISLNLSKLATGLDTLNNPILNPSDTLRIIKENLLIESRQIRINYTKKELDENGASKSRQIEVSKLVNIAPNMNLRDLLLFNGGLPKNLELDYIEIEDRVDISEKGLLGLKSAKREVRRIPISRDWYNDKSLDTVKLSNTISLTLHDRSEYYRMGFVQVNGLVNTASDSIIARPNMTLKDVFYEVGGLSIQSDFGRIVIARVLDIENTNGKIQPVPVIIKTISVNQDWRNDASLDSIRIFPFDQVFVRPDPLFRLQENVTILGEVVTPGDYAKVNQQERLSSLVARAFGLSKVANPEAAYLIRKEYGKVSISLDRALAKPGSRFDLILVDGDSLVVPPISEVVKVEGNVFKPNISLMFDPTNVRASYYVDLAGGFEPKSAKSRLTVSYADGRVKKAWSILGLFRIYPRVKQGSTVYVPSREKAVDPNDPYGQNKKRLTMQEAVATSTSLLTFLVLLKNVLK